MTAAVETMAWTGETPWHGEGFKVDNTLTPEQMVAAAKINWTVSKRKAFFEHEGQMVPAKDEYALVRDSDGFKLSMVGAGYKPVQNSDAMDFFKRFVDAGHMTMETAGALWNGRYVWGLARVGKDFKLGNKDEVRAYLLLSSPHVHGRSLNIQFTTVRVVCWNTLTMALGSKLDGGKGKGFRVPHSIAWNDKVKEQAQEAFGLAAEQMVQFKEAATVLAKKKAATAEVEEYFCEVMRYDPKENTRKKKADGSEREPRSLPKFRAALEHSPGQQLAPALGTWWGALNAVTFVIDHEIGRDRTTALRNAWMGHTAGIKRRALDLALQKAVKS